MPINKLKLNTNLENLTILQNDKSRNAARRLALNRKGILFVLDQDDRLTGSVSEGDVRRAFVAGFSPDQPVSDIMFTKPLFYFADTDINMILSRLGSNNKAGEKLYLPILNRDTRKLIGYYSYYDIKFIPVARPDLRNNELEYVIDCIEENWISSQGKYIGKFEQSFASFMGVKHAVAVSNGTAALHLALETLDIGEGDEVIVPSLTFIATANAVTYTGARAVFADSEMDTWNISPPEIRKLITPRTKAIIPVHLYGQPCKMDEIMEIASEHGLFVLEDAAEAHGAKYKGKYVGSIGHLNCFSFFGNKIITTGEGGMILTNDESLCMKARMLRDHGMDPMRKYWHPYVGFNYRMTNLQAAIGLAQVERFDDILERKMKITALYRKNLAHNASFILPPENDWSTNVCWMFSIVLRNGGYNGMSRDSFIEAMRAQNIETRPFFYPVHEMPPYKSSEEQFPVCSFLSCNGISLPSFPELKDDEIAHICDFINGCAPIHHN